MDYYKKELRKIKNQIRDLIDPHFIYDNYCRFCWERSSFKMTVHHRYYIENDVIYKNYPNTIQGRIKYYNDLFPLVRDNPNRFLYICIQCHNILEYYLQFADNLENEIRIELAKTWSDFQYLFNNRHSVIAKFALKELKLDADQSLAREIDERPNQKTGLDEFFWR